MDNKSENSGSKAIIVAICIFLVLTIIFIPFLTLIGFPTGISEGIFEMINPFSADTSSARSKIFKKINNMDADDWSDLFNGQDPDSVPDNGDDNTGSVDSTNYVDALKKLSENVESYDGTNNKTARGLVQFVENAARINCGYVWSWHGREINQTNMDSWQKRYINVSEACADEESKNYTLSYWKHKPGFDCSGLIIGYMTFDPEKASFTSSSHGYGNLTSASLYAKCVVSGDCNDDNTWGNGATYGCLSHDQKNMPKNVPIGTAVLKHGHVGVYVGNDPVRGAIIVEAAGYNQGVVFSYGLNSTRSTSQDFSWWIKLPAVSY